MVAWRAGLGKAGKGKRGVGIGGGGDRRREEVGVRELES